MSKTSFDSKLPLIIAEAQVENKGKITLVMVLDTGASYTIIPYEVADAIGCDPAASSKRTRLITGSGVEMAPVVKVKSIKSLGKKT